MSEPEEEEPIGLWCPACERSDCYCLHCGAPCHVPCNCEDWSTEGDDP